MGAQVLDDILDDSQSRLNRNTLLLLKRKIILNKMEVPNCVDDEFADKLVTCTWIRKTFYEGGIDELVSTRRLEHIVKWFAMFNDRLKIQLCVNRFDTDTKSASSTPTLRLMLVLISMKRPLRVKDDNPESMTMISKPIDYKYNEACKSYLQSYIDSTYGEHYSINNCD